MNTEDWILIRFSSASRRWLWVLNIFSENQQVVNTKLKNERKSGNQSQDKN